jgi:RNA polymerase primary sigma factor
MAYQPEQIEEQEEAVMLFDDSRIEEIPVAGAELPVFQQEKDLERLQYHYFTATESETEEDEDVSLAEDLSLGDDAVAEPLAEAYELPVDEAIDTVGLYLKEMSAVPLLNMAQEVDLAKRIEAGKKARRNLNKSNGHTPAAKRGELERIIEDGRLAREHLIKANTRLVVSIAKKYMGRGVPFLDLIQEGNLGLMKGVSKFDYRLGFRFSTYATWWIRQTITRAIADQGRTIRVPVHMIDRIRLLYKTAHTLEQELGHPPTVEDLAGAMKEDIDKVDWMLRVSWLPLSLESPVGDEEDSELGMFVEDESSPSPSQAAYKNMMDQKVNEVLSTLSPREARILRLRFGLENGRAYTLEEVGEKFGLTRERIRQIEGKALRRLRHPMRARQLREYL